MSLTLGLLGLELCQVGAFNQAAARLEGKNLPSCCEEHLLHVFATNAKAPAGDAGDDLELLLAGLGPRPHSVHRGLSASTRITRRPVLIFLPNQSSAMAGMRLNSSGCDSRSKPVFFD